MIARTVLAFAAVAALALPALAQTKPVMTAPAAPDAVQPTTPPPPSAEEEARLRALGEAYHRAPDEAQTPEELAATTRLNAEIAARNDAASKQESADQAAYAQARADYEASVERGRAERLNYEEGVRTSEAAQRQYEADRARWEQRVRDCNAGVRTACLQPGEAY